MNCDVPAQPAASAPKGKGCPVIIFELSRVRLTVT